MSAYICDNDHISQIAYWLVRGDAQAVPHYWRDRKPSEVGRELWQMNVDAVQQRYGDDDPKELPGPCGFGYKYKGTALAIPDAQTLKSLECYRYQCSEGDVPERELYKRLETAIDWLKSRLISRHVPGYEEAEWGAYEPPKDAPKVYSLSAMIDNA